MDAGHTKPNLAYTTWYRQDAILLSALLGSCTDVVQPLISLADTSADAWSRLTRNLASMSRGRIISLKAKLAKNPRGNRTIATFITDMTEIAAELALAQSPVSDEDLAVHIMSQLGDDYAVIYQSLRGRKDCVSIEELTTILEDCERDIQSRTAAAADLVPSANQTQRARGDRGGASSGSFNRAGNSGPSRGGHCGRGPPSGGNRGSRYCRFCDLSSHDTRFCRKLQRFLRENNVTITSSNSDTPAAHVTVSNGTPSDPQWIVDSGASHHVANDPNSLNTLMEYGGPDEIRLGNGKTLSISHTGRSRLSTSSRPLTLSNVLCVPSLQNNLLSVSQLCRTNHVSVEFFSDHFSIKDVRTGTPLLRGAIKNNLYFLPSPSGPSVNTASVAVSSVADLHHRLGHPNNKIFRHIVRSCSSFSHMPDVSHFHCSSCNINKSHKLPFSTNTLHSSFPLDLIYTDVWSTKHCSLDGYYHYVIFVDHYTKYTWWYPLKRKSDVFSIFFSV